jgi:hypothetical protein
MDLRLLIFLVLAVAIWLGLRRIWRDWQGEARRLDRAARQRDLKERQRPGIITLKRSDDGVFRPGGGDDPRP